MNKRFHRLSQIFTLFHTTRHFSALTKKRLERREKTACFCVLWAAIGYCLKLTQNWAPVATATHHTRWANPLFCKFYIHQSHVHWDKDLWSLKYRVITSKYESLGAFVQNHNLENKEHVSAFKTIGFTKTHMFMLCWQQNKGQCFNLLYISVFFSTTDKMYKGIAVLSWCLLIIWQL